MGLTVGRHAAGDDARVDPIVAAALQARPTTTAPGTPRHGQDSRQLLGAGDGEDGLGWPGEPGDGTGLGWPVDEASGAPGAEQQSGVTLVADEAPARRRSGWRRLFGGGSADRSSAA